MRPLSLVLLLTAACSVQIPSGVFECENDGDCPDELLCRGGLCYAEGDEPDAGALDAATLDAAMLDATMVDGAVPDATVPDATVPDATVLDTGTDAGVPDCSSDLAILIEATGVSQVNAITTHGSHIYVAGEYTGTLDGGSTAEGRDIYVARYGVDGIQDWNVSFGGEQADTARGIAVSPEGVVYVAGTLDLAGPNETGVVFVIDGRNGELTARGTNPGTSFHGVALQGSTAFVVGRQGTAGFIGSLEALCATLECTVPFTQTYDGVVFHAVAANGTGVYAVGVLGAQAFAVELGNTMSFLAPASADTSTYRGAAIINENLVAAGDVGSLTRSVALPLPLFPEMASHGVARDGVWFAVLEASTSTVFVGTGRTDATLRPVVSFDDGLPQVIPIGNGGVGNAGFAGAYSTTCEQTYVAGQVNGLFFGGRMTKDRRGFVLAVAP